MQLDTEIIAARTILETGERLEIPSPFFMRLFGKKTISVTLYDPTADVCLRQTIKRLSMGVTDEDFENMSVEEALQFRAKNGKKVAQIIAIGVLRGRIRYRLFGWWVTAALLRYYPFSTLLTLMQTLTLGGLEDFTTIIGLLKVTRLTRPNEPSH